MANPWWPIPDDELKTFSSTDDNTIQALYVKAGLNFGELVSRLHEGTPADFDFEDAFREWAKFEKEYTRRGFRTITLNAFNSSGGWGKPLDGLGVTRASDESVVFHAEDFYEHNKNQFQKSARRFAKTRR